MASHPYISGAGNITQMITQLRKSFPATVTSDTVKKLGLASKNESYVINALHFIGLIDAEGKRTDHGQAIMTTHDDGQFQKAFEELIKNAYTDLFELKGDEAWTMDKNKLISYFRSADKTSDVIGTRQAGVFQALRAIAGYEDDPTAPKTAKTTGQSSKPTKTKTPKLAAGEVAKTNASPANPLPAADTSKKGGVALSVRIEINLPAEATAETYDNIFKSIRANLMNE